MRRLPRPFCERHTSVGAAKSQRSLPGLNTITWEYLVYNQLQHEGNFPLICERIIDCGPGLRRAALVLHRVSTFSNLFKAHGTSLPYTKFCLASIIIPSLQLLKVIVHPHTTLLRGVRNPWCDQ